MVLKRLCKLTDYPSVLFGLRAVGFTAAAVELFRLVGVSVDLPPVGHGVLIMGMFGWFAWLFRSGTPWDVSTLGWKSQNHVLDFPPKRLKFFALDLSLLCATLSAVVTLSPTAAAYGAFLYGLTLGLGLANSLLVTGAKIHQWRHGGGQFVEPSGAAYLVLLSAFYVAAGVVISTLHGVDRIQYYGGMCGVAWTLFVLLHANVNETVPFVKSR